MTIFAPGKMQEQHQTYEFENGIRLIYQQVNNTRLIHCGFIMDAGSRDETPEQHGLAHFWEHMAFKGTTKRKAFHIINRLESVGGELNAFTTKEKICFYASVLEEYFEKAVDLLTDITFHSVFPEKQIDKERQVILDEIAMYDDSPEDALQDEFDEVVFGDHPLGKNILGSHDALKLFSKPHFLDFIKQNVSSRKIVFSVVGSYPFGKIVKVVRKYIDDLPVMEANHKRLVPPSIYDNKVIRERSFGRAYCAIGRDAYNLTEPERYPFFMLTNILGGPGMNSRLNLSLREKYGYVYSIDATYHGFTDSGMTAIYFGTERKYLNRSIKQVLKELKKLREVRLGTLQLHAAKQQIKGQLAMAEENNSNLMLMLGRSILDLEKIETLEEIFKKIDNIGGMDLMDVANDIWREQKLNYLIFQPI